MKLKRLFLTAFAAIAIAAVSSAGMVSARGEGEPEPGGTQVAETQILFGEDGAFQGVRDDISAEGGVYFGIRSGMTEGRSELLRFTIDFDEAIDPSQSTGIYFKILTPDFKNGSFKILLKDTDGNYWRMFHGSSTSHPFVLEDGTVSAIPMSKNNFAWVAAQTGTLYVPWSQTFASVGASGSFLDAEKTRRVESVSFCFTLAANSSGAVYYGGRGMTVYSVGTATVGTGASDSSAVRLLTAASATATAAGTKTDAGVNYTAIDKGTTYRVDGAFNSSVSATIDGTSADYASVLAYGELSRSDATLTVRYETEDGTTLRDSDTQKIALNRETGEYGYSIEPPAVAEYEFDSSDLPLSGSFAATSETITLVYRPAEIPDTDWDETTSNDVYEATFDENGVLASLNVKSDMDQAVYMGIKKDMTAKQSVYAQLSLGFGEGIDTSASTGLFVKFLGARTNYGFKFMITDSEGNVYTAYGSCVGKDMFTTEDGNVISLTEKNSQHVFKDGAGTWYVPWEYFSLLGGADKMPSGTRIVSVSFAMNLTKVSWYGGYGIRVASAGTVKAGAEKTKVEVLLDAAGFVYTSDPEDGTADVNTADVTKGKTVFCRAAFDETNVLESGEDYALAVADAEFAAPSVEITLRCVDEKGQSIRDEEVLTFAAGKYEITPPTIMGYVFLSSDQELSGTASSATEIVLTYELAVIRITVKYVDTDGNEIAAAGDVSCKYKDIYSVEAIAIDGYRFVESSRKLSGTAMADMTITLTYEKSAAEGCGSSLGGGFAALCIGAMAASLFACSRRKK